VATIWSEGDCEAITDFHGAHHVVLRVRPGDIVQNGLSYGLWVAGPSVHYAAKRIGCLVIPIGAATTARQIDYLETGSTVLLATPSYALHIAETLRQRGMSLDRLALRLGCFGGEAGAGNPATRAKIEAAGHRRLRLLRAGRDRADVRLGVPGQGGHPLGGGPPPRRDHRSGHDAAVPTR
jgi:phenylacetate-CoA ligase